MLLKREFDVHTKTSVVASSLVAGFHDARAGSGDDHVSAFANQLRKFFREFVFGMIGFCARRSEDRDLPNIFVGLKNFKRVTKFSKRATQQLHVATADLRLDRL